MNIDELYEQLDSSRVQLLELLEQLPDAAMLEPGVSGEWSVADILAHLVVWESELVTCLMKLDRGKKPNRLLDAISDVDGYNAMRYEENKGRDLDLIFDDLQGVRVQLEEWLPLFSDRDLTDPKRYRWNDDLALWQIIEANTFGHEAEHLPEIEAFVKKWKADQESDQ